MGQEPSPPAPARATDGPRAHGNGSVRYARRLPKAESRGESMLSVPLWVSLSAALPPQEPIRIGVVAVDKPDSGDLHFLRAGRLAVDACNGKGGVLGSPVELVVEAAATPADAMAAVGRLDGAGVVAVIAPPETRLGEVVRRAAQSKMPCAGFAPQPAAIARTLDALLSKTFRVQQIAFVRDASKEAHELGRLLG